MDEIIGLTCGTYDAITPSDLSNFKHFKTICDKLIIGLKPSFQNSFEERITLLKLIPFVDDIIIFEDINILKKNNYDLIFINYKEIFKQTDFKVPIYYFN